MITRINCYNILNLEIIYIKYNYSIGIDNQLFPSKIGSKFHYLGQPSYQIAYFESATKEVFFIILIALS